MNDSAKAVLFQWETVPETLFQSNATTPGDFNNTNNHTLLDNNNSSSDYINDDTTFTSSRSEASVIISGILFAIVIILTCWLCYMLLPLLIGWVKSKIPVSPTYINNRYHTVEYWLITKRVKAHCRVCEIVQRHYGVSRPSAPPPTIQLTTSHETAEMTLHNEPVTEEEEEGQSCPICMEPFQHKELVSFSPMAECDHVFHHACIKTWLLHHACCPYCRGCMLSPDHRGQQNRRRWKSLPKTKHERKREDEYYNEMSLQRGKRLRATYFCMKEGLVTLDLSKMDKANAENPVSLIPKRKITGAGKEAIGFFTSDFVPQHELMPLRTHPKSIRSTTDVVVTVTSPSSPTLPETTADTNAVDDATAANAVIDIETTLNELPVISDDVADANDTV